jgi:Holliday junction DNA helicase RuvA
MIGKLTGIVDSLGPDNAILDVAGVGYLVHCSTSTLARLTAGTSASLMIEMRVTDESIRLYGFFGAEERAWPSMCCPHSRRASSSARLRLATRPWSVARRA